MFYFYFLFIIKFRSTKTKHSFQKHVGRPSYLVKEGILKFRTMMVTLKANSSLKVSSLTLLHRRQIVTTNGNDVIVNLLPY